ncbi:MAG: hypothetical protein GY730_10845 [bacterium]|nr:hypothetical protein [bacterium]
MKYKNTILSILFLIFSIFVIALYYIFFPSTGDSINAFIKNVLLYLIFIGIFTMLRTLKHISSNLSLFSQNNLYRLTKSQEPVLIRLKTRNIVTHSNRTGKVIDFINAGDAVRNINIIPHNKALYKIIVNAHYEAKTLSMDKSGNNIVKMPGKMLGKNWEGRLSIQKLSDIFQTNEKVYFTIEYTNIMGQDQHKHYCYSEIQANFSEVDLSEMEKQKSKKAKK